ncbi:T9SS type B sorting domain-containing protein, partial [Capnocytophaga canimorsus]
MRKLLMKNYDVVTRCSVRILMVVAMFFTTTIGFSQSPPTSYAVLVGETDPPQPSVCGDAGEYVVELILGNTASNDATLEITLPNDFEYEDGSIQANVGSATFQSRSGNKVILKLNVPATSTTSPKMSIRFRARTLCGAIATTVQGATKPKILYRLIGVGTEQIKSSKDINVLYAALQTSITPSAVNLPSGEQVERTIDLRNGGNGTIKSFRIKTTLGAGLQIVSSDTSPATDWTVSDDGAGTYEFSGGVLAPGQTVSIKQTVRLQGCTDFSSSYTATYGCDALASCDYPEINAATETPAISLDNTKKPILEIIHVGADGNPLTVAKNGGLCLDTDIYHYIKIENKGQGVAKDLIFTIETSTGDRFGSTYFIENSYEMADDHAFTQNVETPILTAPMAGDGYKWKAEWGGRFGTTGKHWLYEMRLRDIPAGGALYVRVKSRNNSATVGCATTPANLAYGYIVSKVRYSNANQCVTSAPVTTNQTPINVGQEIDFRGFNEASVSVEGGKVYNGSFNVNRVLATWNGLKKDDYFDIVLQLSPSFTNIQESSLKLFTNTGVPVNPSEVITNGNEVRFRFKYQNDIKPYDNKVWSGADFSINGLKIKFDATYNCGTTVGGDEAWYKLNMELKRTESCGTSFTMPTRCIKVDLTPYGCSSGCADGFVREIPTIERTVYGFEPTDPDNQGVPKYDGSGNLIPINPDTYTRTLQKSSFHIGDRIRFKQSGKVNKTTADQWTQGQFSFPMPENLHADADPLTIIDPQSVILTLQRAGATYTATALGLIQTGNKTITVNFDIPTLQAKGFPPSIADFQNGDVLTISMDMTPNKFGHTSQGQKLFYPNFKLIHNGADVVCGPPGIANSYYGITRFGLHVVPNQDQYPTYRQILECERGSQSYFYFDTFMNEILTTNAMFPNEHRTFLRPKKIWFNVPKGLILTGVKLRLDGQGSANFSDTHIDIDADNGDGNDAEVTDNTNYGFDLEKALRTLINNKVGHGDKPLHIDEGYRIFIVPEVKLNCYSGEAEVLSMEMELEGTGHSVNHSGFTHFNQTNIRTIRREIKYLADNDKITTTVAQPNYVGNTNEVRWVVQVANSSTFHKFTNLWIASTDMEITSVQEVTDATGNTLIGITPTKEPSGIFKLDKLEPTKTRYFLVTANVPECGTGNKNILFGQGCEGYPNAIDADSPCVKKLPVKYTKTEAAFQVKIISQPPADTRPKLCDQIEYDIEVNNSGAGLAKDITLNIPLGTDQGLFFVPGSAHISQKYTTGTQNTTGSWANANVTSANDIITISLGDNTLSSGEKIRVRFKVQTTNDCKFASHQKLQFIPKGKNFCGSEIININSATSDNLIIEGDTSNRPVVVINQSTAVVTFNEVGATGKPSAKYTLKFSNEGSASNADPINANAKLAIKLPTGWTFNSPQEIVTKSVGKLEYEGLQDDFYVYKLLTPVIKGQFLELNDVSMEFTGIFPCNIAQDIHTELYYVIDAGVFGSSCSPTPSCNLKTIIVERKMPLEISLPKANLKAGANTEFCGTKTVADLSNLIEQNANLAWYTTATGGTALASTHQITSTTYYVALKDALTGCESAERLAVSVTIKEQSERGHITKTEDAFCNVNSVTVAQLKSYINNQGEDGEIKIYEIDPVTQAPTTLKTDADQLTAGQMYAYTRTQVGKCESVYNHITLTIGKSATPAALTETLCGAISVDNLKAKFVVPVGAVIKVYLGTSEVTSGDLMAGFYQVSVVENGKCESNKQNVIIHTSADVPTFTIVNKDCTTLGSVTISNYNGINTYEFSDTALTMDDTTGKITGFVYGQAYTVTVTAAGGCQAQATFTVNDTCVIDAVDDTFAPVSGTVGGEAGNVLSDNGNGKDKLGSEDATTSNVQISVVTPAGTGNVPQLDTTTGKVTVPAGTPAGTYTIVYKICDNNNLSNCDTATATILVSTIKAEDDDMSGSPVNGSVGNPNVVNVLTNDIFDGVPNILISKVKLTVISQATPIGSTTNVPTLDSATGDVSVPTGTPAGTYTITYEICISGTTICDTATATVVVTAQLIKAQDDTFAPIAGVTGGTAGNVLFDNGKGADMLGGNPVTVTDVTISEVTPATPINGGNVPSLNIATGEVTVPANTPAGTYSIVYQICEKLNPSNCSTATATVVVTAQDIVAQDDTFAPIAGVTGGTVGNVLSDNGKGADMLGGNPATVTNVTISEVTPATPINGGNVPSLNKGTGEVTVPANTPAGTYSIVYQICEKLNPSNCDTATATVVVSPADLEAVPDDFSATPIRGTDGGKTSSVLTNDKLNGTPLNPSDVTLTWGTIPSGFTPNADGTITVVPNTPAGTYTLTYTICEKLNPSNCKTTTVKVVVVPDVIEAQDDTFAPIAGVTGGTAGNVLSDNGKGADMLGVNPATVTDVTISEVTPATPINGGNVPSLNIATGEVTVPANTPAGTYSIVYQICEKLNSSNCDTATATVVVSPADLEAVPDDFTATPIGGTDGGKTSSVLTNDKLNGTPLNPSDVTLTWGTIPSGFTPNADGTITVVPNTPAGTYTLTYTICEVLNPSNCKTTTVTVLVTASPIVANDDDYTMYPIYTTIGGTVSTSVLVNDTFEGVTATLGTVTISNPTTPNTNINIDPASGMVVVLPNTPVGTYTLTYTICEKGNPTNCSNQANVIVVVLDVPKASDDSATTEINTPVVVNILENDQNIPAIGKVSVVSGPSQGSVQVNDGGTPNDPSDDTVTYTPNLGFVGTDSFVYELCDAAGNCASATVTIEVVAGGDITPYNAISINDDGSNDVFYIKGIEGYPNNTVRIYNRWGVKVFEAHGYNNTTKAFRGISNGRVTVDVDKKLPQGTYYYVLEYTDASNQTHSEA